MRRGPMRPCPTGPSPRKSGGPRAGAAGDRAQRADRSLDHRRHGFSQEGAALGRGTPANIAVNWVSKNCQVAVTLSLANRHASLLVAYRLYLPEDWAKDQDLRHKA